jgi:hypothetical protein
MFRTVSLDSYLIAADLEIIKDGSGDRTLEELGIRTTLTFMLLYSCLVRFFFFRLVIPISGTLHFKLDCWMLLITR